MSATAIDSVADDGCDFVVKSDVIGHRGCVLVVDGGG